MLRVKNKMAVVNLDKVYQDWTKTIDDGDDGWDEKRTLPVPDLLQKAMKNRKENPSRYSLRKELKSKKWFRFTHAPLDRKETEYGKEDLEYVLCKGKHAHEVLEDTDPRKVKGTSRPVDGDYSTDSDEERYNEIVEKQYWDEYEAEEGMSGSDSEEIQNKRPKKKRKKVKIKKSKKVKKKPIQPG